MQKSRKWCEAASGFFFLCEPRSIAALARARFATLTLRKQNRNVALRVSASIWSTFIGPRRPAAQRTDAGEAYGAINVSYAVQTCHSPQTDHANRDPLVARDDWGQQRCHRCPRQRFQYQPEGPQHCPKLQGRLRGHHERRHCRVPLRQCAAYHAGVRVGHRHYDGGHRHREACARAHERGRRGLRSVRRTGDGSSSPRQVQS